MNSEVDYGELVKQGILIPIPITAIAEEIIEIDGLIATLKIRRRRMIDRNPALAFLIQLELDRLRSLD